MDKSKPFLNDKAFTQVFIDILINNSASEEYTFADLDFRYLHASEGFLKFYNCMLSDIIGKQFIEIQPDDELAKFIRQIATSAIQNKHFERRIVSTFKDEMLHLVDLVIDPVINPYTKNYVGVVAYINVVMVSNPLKEIIKKINKKINVFNPNSQLDGMDLSEREHEILLLLVIGKSYKEIAKILSDLHGGYFSPTGVSNIIYRKLFEKFNVGSLSKLTEKAIELDIINNIPKSFV